MEITPCQGDVYIGGSNAIHLGGEQVWSLLRVKEIYRGGSMRDIEGWSECGDYSVSRRYIEEGACETSSG